MMLTRTSVELGVASVVLAVAGIAAGYPELVLLAAAGLAALAAALGWVAVARFRLVAGRSFLPDQPRAGQTLTVRLHVANRGSRPNAVLPVVEMVDAIPYPVEIPAIGAARQAVASYRVPGIRRGRLRVERAPVVRRDPLGLARATVMAGGRSEIRVQPDWHPEVAPLPAPGLASGLAETGLPRGDVVFHSLREYRPGDPARLIHWPATARRGGPPIIRELTDPGEPTQVLLLDTALGAYPPDLFEEAVRITASLVMAAGRQGLGLELRTTGDGELLSVGASDQLSGDARTLLDPLCDVAQSASVADLADAVDELARAAPARYGSAVLGIVCGPRSAEPPTAAPALTRAGRVFEAVHLIRVGTAAAPARVDGVIHTEVGTSGQFAAEGGARWLI
jgi:uncharacterized protein (DUF58 family)